MSDFTLPRNDDVRRAEVIASYRRDITTATSLAKQNENVQAPAEEVIVSIRQANRMAFELMMAGEHTEDEWKEIIGPFAKYLPKRAYVRSSETLDAMAEQMETVS